MGKVMLRSGVNHFQGGRGDKKSLCAIRFFWPYLNDFVKLCHLEVIWCWSRVKSDKRDQLSIPKLHKTRHGPKLEKKIIIVFRSPKVT